MEDLVLGIPPVVRGLLMAAAAVALLVIVRRHEQLFAPAKMASNRRIVAFELAGNPKAGAAILSAWGAEGRAGARRAITIDFALAAAYAILLWLACAGLAGVVGERTWAWMQDAGEWLAGLVLVAGLLDWVENWALLRILAAFRPGEQAGGIGRMPPAVAAAAAAVKFAIVIPAILYVGFGLAVLWAGTP